jgi:hypothetical protein
VSLKNDILIDSKIVSAIDLGTKFWGKHPLFKDAIKLEIHSHEHEKRKQFLGWFNKEFIKTGIIDQKYGRIIHQALEDRCDGDYGIFQKQICCPGQE